MDFIKISTDKSLLNVPLIHHFLSERSYWAKGRSMATVQTSIVNSLCFGAYYQNGRQVGFARVVTDYAVFGWIMDVFVIEEYRGKGIGKQLMEAIVNHPDLKRVNKLGLGTEDAHGLYQQFGFSTPAKTENLMMLLKNE